MTDSRKTGRVHKKLGNVAYVVPGGGGAEIACGVRGKLKLGERDETSVVCVGDFVEFELDDSGAGTIHKISARKTLLARSSVLTPEIADPIVANVEMLVIVVSVNPVVKPGIVDRYLVAAEAGGITPAIVLNKIDLPKAKSESAKLDVYRRLGLAVFETSAKNQAGIDGLKRHIAGKCAVFCGHSGVGKSSLLNEILGLNIKVGIVASKTLKGRHTTSHTEIFENPGGGLVADTPGIKSFGIVGIHSDDVIQCFPELFAASRDCEFRDCRHIRSQQGCAIIAKVESAEILETRYESWLKLKTEISDIETY